MNESPTWDRNASTAFLINNHLVSFLTFLVVGTYCLMSSPVHCWAILFFQKFSFTFRNNICSSVSPRIKWIKNLALWLAHSKSPVNSYFYYLFKKYIPYSRICFWVKTFYHLYQFLFICPKESQGRTIHVCPQNPPSWFKGLLIKLKWKKAFDVGKCIKQTTFSTVKFKWLKFHKMLNLQLRITVNNAVYLTLVFKQLMKISKQPIVFLWYIWKIIFSNVIKVILTRQHF